MKTMRKAVLRTNSGSELTLRACQWQGRTFVECLQSEDFLAHITGADSGRAASAADFVRGVIIPGEGAYFQLFDQFGTVVRDMQPLTDREARERLLDIMIWRVDGNDPGC